MVIIFLIFNENSALISPQILIYLQKTKRIPKIAIKTIPKITPSHFSEVPIKQIENDLLMM